MINEKELNDLLLKGISYQQIGDILGYSKSNVKYYVDKYNLNKLSKYKKPIYNETYFHKIDTKEKAYILGFILGDGSLNEKDKLLEITIALDDKCILDFIANQMGGNIHTYNEINKKQRRFPRARMRVGNKNIFIDIHKLFGGYLKPDRHIPILSPYLERYLIQGFFDAEGCITFGRRKDRNRLWHKISFTSQFKMLTGIQKILDKNDISSSIKPKSKEDCFELLICDKKRISDFLNYIYPDDSFIILKRKYKKSIALRLELGEFGES